MHHTRITSTLLLAVAAGSASAAPQSIGIRMGENESTIAYDINASGQVAADLEDENGIQRAVLFHRGVLTELGTLGGDFSNTKAINEHGEIVGSAQDKAGHWRAYLYRRGAMTDLGTLGGASSFGLAINNHGDAAGFATTTDGQFRAFHVRDGAMADLGTLGGKNSYASGLNNVGQVVGTAEDGRRFRHAFVWDAARGMRDLGTLGGRQSSATAINDAGVIVGTSEMPDRKWHAFVYENGKMVDLGAKIGYGNSFAKSINSAGHVVGTIAIGPERQTFVWRDGRMAIHYGAYSLYVTNAINDTEQVVGATKGKRLEAAVMSASAIPVIADKGLHHVAMTMGLMIAAAGAFAVQRRRFQGLNLRSFG